MTSKNGGYPGGIDWSTVYAVAERTLAGLGEDGMAVVVYIGTTERSVDELSDSSVSLAADEGFLRLGFTNGVEDAESGDYAPRPDQAEPNTVTPGIRVTGGTTVQLDAFDTIGEATLIAAGDQVCGTFEFADDFTSASGTFVADLVP